MPTGSIHCAWLRLSWFPRLPNVLSFAVRSWIGRQSDAAGEEIWQGASAVAYRVPAAAPGARTCRRLHGARVFTAINLPRQPGRTRAAHAHLEPENVLIAPSSRRSELQHRSMNMLWQARTGCILFRPASRRSRFATLGDFEWHRSERPNELDWSAFSQGSFRILRTVLGDRAQRRHFDQHLERPSNRANWAFAASIDRRKRRQFQRQLDQYLRQPKEGSLIGRLPKSRDFDLESQVAQWLFAHHPSYWAKAVDEVKDPELDRRFRRNCLLEALRLWRTTPVILRELTEDIKSGDRTVAIGTGVFFCALLSP